MEKIIEVNGNLSFSDNHELLTKRGLIKASELISGDVIYGVAGECEITKISKYSNTKEHPIIKGIVSVENFLKPNENNIILVSDTKLFSKEVKALLYDIIEFYSIVEFICNSSENFNVFVEDEIIYDILMKIIEYYKNINAFRYEK